MARLCALLQSYSGSMFSENKWDVGFCTTLPFRLDPKPDARPCSDRAYRYSPAMTALIRVEIDKLLAAGIIRPSRSEWASPVVQCSLQLSGDLRAPEDGAGHHLLRR